MVCAQIEQLLANKVTFSFISNLLKASWGPRQALKDIVTLSQVSKCPLSVLYSPNHPKKRLKLKQNWFKNVQFGFLALAHFYFVRLSYYFVYLVVQVKPLLQPRVGYEENYEPHAPGKSGWN